MHPLRTEEAVESKTRLRFRAALMGSAFFALASMSGAFPSLAQNRTADVRGGEHGKFSRVVFDFGEKVPFRTELSGKDVVVFFDGVSADVNVAHIQRKTAHRVVAAVPEKTPQGTSVRLKLNCDCEFKAYAYGRRVVVDVSERQAGAKGQAQSKKAAEKSLDEDLARKMKASVDAAIKAGMLDPAVPSVQEPLPSPSPSPAPDSEMVRPETIRPEVESEALEKNPAPVPEIVAPQAEVPTVQPPVPVETAIVPEAPEDACPKSRQPMFDLVSWRGEGPFLKELDKRNAWQADLKGEELVAALLDTARFYFAWGMAEEGIATLDLLSKAAPEKLKVAEVSAMKDALYLMRGWIEDIGKSFENPELCSKPDVDLWKAVLAAALGESQKAVDTAVDSQDALASYPSDIRSDLALRLAEAALNVANVSAAEQLLSWVARSGPEEEQKVTYRYLQGRLHEEKGELPEAREAWSEAAKYGRGRASAVANMSLIEDGVASGTMKPNDAAVRLRQLQYDWRGDPFEIRIIEMLGRMDADSGDYYSAMELMDRTQRRFSGEPRQKVATDFAESLLREVYVAGKGADMTPVQNLSLFIKYGEFVPKSGSGDEIRLSYARKLLEYDLTAQATEILGKLKTSSSPEVSRGALLTLADALSRDRHYEEAISAIREARTANLTDEERKLAVRTEAAALAGLGKFLQAADKLNGVEGEEISRAEYLWMAKDWRQASVAYDRIRKDVSFSPDAKFAGDVVLRLAASAYMSGDREILDSLSESDLAAADKAGKGGYVRALKGTPYSGGTTVENIKAALKSAEDVAGLKELAR